MLLKFGTPIFVFISGVLLSYKYSREIPKNFILKRAKYILIPFILMAILYGLLTPLFFESHKPVLINIFENLLGGYHGYFVLIVFQFYFLHIIFVKYLKNVNFKIVLFLSFLINAIYLAFFNLTTPPESGFFYYLWVKLYYMPFIAWVFYFAVAFYVGMNYKKVKLVIEKISPWILLFPILFGGVVLFNFYFEIIPSSSSKRIDMIFYVFSWILVIVFISTRSNYFPGFLNKISKYAFGIYLTHMFFVYIWTNILLLMNINKYWIELPLLFTLVISSAIFITWFLNKLPYGEYVVGKIGIDYSNSKKSQFLK